MIVCRRCIVAGRVQGVFYRATTQAQAEQLGVSGYAKNLSDGTVEVMACGPEELVEKLCEWLWQGPGLAKVDNVDCELVTHRIIKGFIIL